MKANTNITIKDLPFPLYNGLESCYEDVVYKFLKETVGKLGYEIKIKKTNYDNIDKNLIGRKKLSCDAYILNQTKGISKELDEKHDLMVLFELETTGKINAGIEQVLGYQERLQKAYSSGNYKTNNKELICMVFDGQQLIAWKYDFNKKLHTDIPSFGKLNIKDYKTSDKIDVTISFTETFIKLFPSFTSNEIEKPTAVQSITNISNAIRGHRVLQDNKAFLITILAAIYGKTNKENLTEALKELEDLSVTLDEDNKEAKGIYQKWKDFEPKIQSSNISENKVIDNIIYNNLYNEAKNLYGYAKDENMDLYGYIYEELAAVLNKKSDGEFYTSRTVIRPIVNCVIEKYFKEKLIKTPNGETSELKENILKNAESLKVADIFCGSGGFLYEYLKYFKTNIDKITDNELNSIAKHSLVGLDKNDIMAAFLNMYLIGDGATDLAQVTTSINWKNEWAYKKVEKDNKPVAELIAKTEEDLENSDIRTELQNKIIGSIQTFNHFLNLLIDWNKAINDFYIKSKFSQNKRIKNIIDFFKVYADTSDINRFYQENLINYAYVKNNGIIQMTYDILKDSSESPEKCISYEDFEKQLGNTDLLLTNIPYGKCNDVLYSTSYKGPLETLSLKECIDLLKPSTTGIYSYKTINGKKVLQPDFAGHVKMSNNDGGIASIVVPNGILESENNKEIRDYLFERCNILSIIKLPALTFAPYANIQTFVITIQKKAIFEYSNPCQEKNTFVYIVDNDGKANSQNRFSTNLENKTIVKTPRGEVSVIENLHNELDPAVSMYPEGYLSKIERAWLFGENEYLKDWNQIRYTEDWTGTEWQEILETKKKWTFSNLKEKTFTKRVNKSKKSLKTLIDEILTYDESLISLDFDEQKVFILNELINKLFNNIPFFTVTEKTNKKGQKKYIFNFTDKPIKNNLFKNLIENNIDCLKTNAIKEADGSITYEIKSSELKEILIKGNYFEVDKTYKKIFEDLNSLDEIEIKIVKKKTDEEDSEDSGDVSYNVNFYITEKFNQYSLVPEDYLDKKEDFMSEDEIIANILRLRKMMKEE